MPLMKLPLAIIRMVITEALSFSIEGCHGQVLALQMTIMRLAN